MAIDSRTTLKTYFETGDRPTAAQFIQLIDSLSHQLEGPTPVTTTADDATPTVAATSFLIVNNAAPTTITDFDDGVANQHLTVLIAEANTGIADSGDITLDSADGDYAAQAGGALFKFVTDDGVTWYEASRRVF